MNGSIILIYFFINEALKQFDSFLCYLVDYLNDNDIDYRFFVRADNNLQIRNKIKKLTILEGEELSGYRKFLLLYTKKKELRKTISDYSKEEKPSFVYFRDNPFYSKFFLSILKKNNPNLKNGFQLTFPFYKERGVLSRFIKKIYVQEMKKMHYVFPISQKMNEELVESGIHIESLIIPMGIDERSIIKPIKERPRNDELIKMIYVGSLRYVEEFFRIMKRVIEKTDNSVKINVIARETSEFNKRNNRIFLDLMETLDHHQRQRLQLKINLSLEETLKEISSSDIGISYIPQNKIYWESSPTKTYEYLLMAKPCVASNTVEEHCFLFQNQNFFSLSSNDIEEFSNKLISFSKKSKEELSKYCIMGQKWVIENRSYKNMMQTLFDLIQLLS